MQASGVQHWIDSLQSRGRYTFVRSKAVAGCRLSSESVKKALQRLARRGRVVKVNDYFFVIVPLEYTNAGAPPPPWFIHDVMAAMKLPYYVGLLSAAALHGASHQQPQEFQVITTKSVRPLRVGRARIRFFVSKHATRMPTLDAKTPTGSMRVSTPEATAMDLVRFAKAAGHLDSVATIIDELAGSLEAQRLLKVIRLCNDVPTTQRLGYLLDRVGASRLARPVHDWVQAQSPRLVPLRPGSVNGADADMRWRVLVTEPLEIET